MEKLTRRDSNCTLLTVVPTTLFARMSFFCMSNRNRPPFPVFPAPHVHAGGGEGRRRGLFPRHGREGQLLHRGNHGQGQGEFRKKISSVWSTLQQKWLYTYKRMLLATRRKRKSRGKHPKESLGLLSRFFLK